MTPAAAAAAVQASHRARELAARALPANHELISALQVRYVDPAPEDRGSLDQAYANAMRGVAANHPDDVDVAALFADSLMILKPWNLWSPDGVPAAETPEIRRVLETALEQAPDHPALCHFYIHTMEASPWPELALPAADALRDRIPGSGHLVHMPSHIDIQIGRYDEAIRANEKGILADGVFCSACGP